jgi:hypothetical protein
MNQRSPSASTAAFFNTIRQKRSIDNLLKRASDTLAEPANAHPARPEGLRPLSAQAGGQVGH